MSEPQAEQDGGKVFPIFYKKKVLSLEKTKELQESLKEAMQENDELLEDEKLVLDKIRIKHNAFVERLEAHLEDFKKANVQKIILKQDMLPVWSAQEEDASGSNSDNLTEIDDITERLTAWYNAMDTYVDLQFDGVEQIMSDWFSLMDKIASEGEPDLQETPVDLDFVSESSDPDAQRSDHIYWYVTLILFCAVNMVIFFFKPEEINQCIDNGFYNCFMDAMKKTSIILYHHYLRFHNITIDYPLENSTAEVTS